MAQLVARLIGVALALGSLSPSLGPAAAAEAPTSASGVEACYMAPYAADQRLPFAVSQEEWCHPLYVKAESTSLDGAIQVTWEPASRHVSWYCGPGNAKQDCPITEYRVETYGRNGPVRCSAGPDQTSCVVTGLRNRNSYTVTLSAYVSNGNWFRVYLVGTPCCDPPGSPTAVSATAQGTSIDVSWSPPRDWGGSQELEYRVATVPPSGTCTTTALACRIEGAAYGTSYRAVVTPANRTDTGSPAESAQEVAIPLGPPDPPLAQGARYPSPGRAVVTWTPPQHDGGSPVIGYTATSSPGGRTCTASGRATSCVITGLSGGRAYSFSVVAKNGLGTSAASGPAVAGVLLSPASVPRGVRATASGTTANVRWSRPSSLGGGKLVQYVVRATPGNRTCETRATSCTLTGLGLGSSYGITVTAVTTVGRGKPATASLSVPAPRAEPPKPQQELS